MGHLHETGSQDASEPGGGFRELLTAVRAGDESASRAVVQRLHDQVQRIVLAHLPRRDDPEDLMQEVFLKVFSRLDQYRAQVPFEHWVSRVAVTTCLDRLRRQQSRPELRWADLTEAEQEWLEGVPAAADPGEVASANCTRELLDRLLASLNPKERLLIRWLDLELKSIAEVCELTGWNSGVTRIRAFRARRKLKAALAMLEQKET